MTLVIDREWFWHFAGLTVRVFRRRERIAYCTHCDAWSRVGTHSHT